MPEPSVVTLGNFDGVHRGHRRLLDAVALEARTLGRNPVAVTFEPHPTTFFASRDPSTFRLMTSGERSEALASLGIHAHVLCFDEALAQQTAASFVKAHLVDALHVRSIHIGEGFVFGRGREGTTALLEALGESFGFAVHVHPPVRTDDGTIVSSTRLRAYLQHGDLAGYEALAGSPWAIAGTRATGAGRGRTIGIPTINLLPTARLLPPFGVYATWLEHEGVRYAGISNLGVRPTFDGEGAAPSLETLCLDASPQVAPGDPVRVTLLSFLRPERSFPSSDELVAQIRQDTDAARAEHARRAVSPSAT